MNSKIFLICSIVLVLIVSLLSIFVFAYEDDGLESVEVSKPDSRGIVTIVGEVANEEGVIIKGVRLRNPLSGQIVNVEVHENGRFTAKIPAKEGQELDITVISVRTIASPMENLEPGLKAFSTAVNGGVLALESMKNAYKSPVVVEGKYNFVAHNSMGPFAAAFDAGRALSSAKK